MFNLFYGLKFFKVGFFIELLEASLVFTLISSSDIAKAGFVKEANKTINAMPTAKPAITGNMISLSIGTIQADAGRILNV